MSHISDSYTNGKLNNVCKQQTKRLGSQTIADWCIPRRKPLSPLDSSLKVEHRWPKLITRDDVVSQRLKFGSAFLSSSWESKIALLFGRGTTVITATILFIISILFSRVTVNVLVFVLRVVFFHTMRRDFALSASFVLVF